MNENPMTCGTPAELQPETVKNSAGKCKWWMIAIPAVLVVAIAAVVLWQPIAFALAPRAVLLSATEKTAEAMEDYLAGGPLELLMTGLDYTQPFRMELYGKYDNEDGVGFLMEMDIATDPEKVQSLIDADINFMGTRVEGLQLYMDRQALAVSYEPFQDGKFYGVNYGSFQEDILSGELGSYLDQEALAQIQDTLRQLQDAFAETEAEISFAEPYARIIAEFIAGLEETTGSQNIALEGTEVKCNTVSFHMTQAQLQGLYEQILEQMKKDEALRDYVEEQMDALASMDSAAALTYDEMLNDLEANMDQLFEGAEFDLTYIAFLHKGMLVAYRLDCMLEKDGVPGQISCAVQYGVRPGNSPVSVVISATSEDQTMQVRMRSAVERLEDQYIHTLSIDMDIPDEEPVRAELKLDWNRSTGDMTIQCSDDGQLLPEEPLQLTLKAEENGYYLGFRNEDAVSTYAFDLRFAQGGEVAQPEYITPDKWTMADLEALMTILYGAYA